jgi:hypothetical protein
LLVWACWSGLTGLGLLVLARIGDVEKTGER